MKRSEHHHTFYYAWRGLVTLCREELNFQIEAACALLVLVLAVILGIRGTDAALLAIVTGLVLILEVINSVLERMADAIKPRLHQYFGDIKDMMAGGVLVASAVAVIVGALILGPRVYNALIGFLIVR